MTEEALVELLAARTAAVETSRDCPSDEAIAAYLDSALDPAALRSFEVHVASCARCVELIAAATRSAELPGEPVPELLLARAKRLPKTKARFRIAPVLASAATVLFGIGLLSFLYVPPDGSTPSVRGERLVERSARAPLITLPRDSSSVDAHKLAVDWNDVPGARYYEVRIVDDDGDLLHVERLSGTEWIAASDLDLVTGHNYFVRVDAYVEEGRPRRSEHVLFKVK